MSDLTLKDGRELTFDLSAMTVAQWRALRNPAFSDQVDDKVIAKVVGLPAEDLAELPMDEYSRVFYGILKKAANPLPGTI